MSVLCICPPMSTTFLSHSLCHVPHLCNVSKSPAGATHRAATISKAMPLRPQGTGRETRYIPAVGDVQVVVAFFEKLRLCIFYTSHGWILLRGASQLLSGIVITSMYIYIYQWNMKYIGTFTWILIHLLSGCRWDPLRNWINIKKWKGTIIVSSSGQAEECTSHVGQKGTHATVREGGGAPNKNTAALKSTSIWWVGVTNPISGPY
jgi:hypothetical protein